MKNFQDSVQRFGKALLFPISLLSFMAIFLGLSAAFQNPNIIAKLPFLEISLIQNFLTLLRRLAGIPFAQLPLLFTMAITLSMAKKDKEIAVYSSVIGYVAMLVGMSFTLYIQNIEASTTSISYLMNERGLDQVEATLYNALFTNSLGIFVYNMNVIGGIISALITLVLHNKFRQMELPAALSFYSGKRFVPIITTIVMTFVGVALTFIWPVMNNAIIFMGKFIAEAGIFGVFLYGLTEKLINPTGLHHILNQVFRFTALGGMEHVGDTLQVGALNIYFAQLEQNLPFSTSATAYLAQGKFLHMMFGLPGAFFALYRLSLPEHRSRVFRYYIPALSAVFLTGITEPIEFTYIFISPILWIANSILAGLSFVLPAILGVAIGNIQGGFIDWVVFGILQGLETKWYLFILLGPIYFALYYLSYSIIIKKFHVMTIGRKKSDFDKEDHTTKNTSSNKMAEEDHLLAQKIVDGLGGIANIVEVDNCISRLRVIIADPALVNEEMIKETQPNGIIKPNPQSIQIVYGGRVTKMRNIVDNYIDRG